LADEDDERKVYDDDGDAGTGGDAGTEREGVRRREQGDVHKYSISPAMTEEKESGKDKETRRETKRNCRVSERK